MKKKTFDCVEMKRAGAKRIYELTKDMTREEELAFWKEREAAVFGGEKPKKSRAASETKTMRAPSRANP